MPDTLCQKSITAEMVDFAGFLLKEFVLRFEILYGVENMTSNVHQLRHLHEIVKRTGPLWTTSCFSYEDLNGIIKSFVHSSNAPHLQILNGVSLYMNISVMRHEICRPGSDIDTFCDRVLSSSKRKKGEEIIPSLFVIGKLSKLTRLPNEVGSFFNNETIKRTYRFKRLLKNNVLYTSQTYRVLKTESFYVKYNKEGNDYYGIIKYYLKLYTCDCRNACGCKASYYVIINKLETASSHKINIHDTDLQFIRKIVSSSENIDVIGVQDLECVCFNIYNQNGQYLIEPVNNIEKE